jgi:sugar/nucleoside kinase (ribokinase family)
MANGPLDVVGIGNAIVDVLSHADDDFLVGQGIVKGAMTLIDAAQADRIYDAMGPGVEISGGSAANTIVGVASFGGRGAYIGKVRADKLGQVFAHDLKAVGVDFDTPMAIDGPSTARCLINVTPDAQRSMTTHLGACIGLGPEDVDAATIAAAKVTYLEGYLWDPPGAKEAFRKAMRIAHEAERKVSLSLSDAFCVDRHRAEFLELTNEHVNILFANESEILSLYQVERLDDALQMVADHCEIAALTRSEKGSIVVANGEVHVIDAEPVERVIDTTGAGDLYAAGFLYGYTCGLSLPECGRLASRAAGEIISHFGARPERDLAALAEEKPN